MNFFEENTGKFFTNIKGKWVKRDPVVGDCREIEGKFFVYDGNNWFLFRPPEQILLETLQKIYRKFWMNDQNIDKQELGKDLKAILINKLGGDHNFTKWLKEVKEEFLMHL